MQSLRHTLQDMAAFLPDHLAKTSAQGIAPGQPIAQFELGTQRNFIYLVIDWKTRQAAIVDPQRDVETPLQALERHGLTLARILLTHSHSDHVAGVPALLERLPGIPVTVHADDQRRIAKKYGPDTNFDLAVNGQRVRVGSLEVEVLHTPGHSAGELCYFVDGAPPHLLTGDTVFIRDCGRTDLDTGDNAQMFESLQKIRKLPPETVILPGHHYQAECASTLERELRESPPFQCKTVEELSALP